MTKKSILQSIFGGLIFVCLISMTVFAQTTVFTYQGKLTDSGGAAQSNYQMQFKLYGSAGGSDQIGGTITNINVAISQGIFTVQLDFGAPAFPGADRFLQIAVRRSSSESFVVLNPRQQINSSPYAIRTLSATQADVALDSNKLGGVDANQYVTTTSIGSSFIKNATTPQTGNFNISGNGIIGDSVGIGITPSIPSVKLDVNGAALFRVMGSGGNIQLGNPNGESGLTIGGGGGNRADLRFDGATLKLAASSAGIPAATSGIVIDTSGNVGIGTNSPNAKLQVSGNVTQGALDNGLVKAMIAVNANGTIAYCYNGITNSSIGNCGFNIAHSTQGVYTITSNFRVNNRFVSVTPQFNSIYFSSHASFVFTGTALIEVNISLAGFGASGGPVQASFLSSQPFTIIVY